MSNEKSHKIDAIKYFVPLPEGDYDFQEHLTDYLLTDILNANKQLEKYEARVKELEEKLKRKDQECEKLEDFRTLAREIFTFGDSEVDDENFIKYLQEYSRSYEEAIDGYCRLTDIIGIDYTVHGGADIEEIIKRVDILKQECEELKERLERTEEDLKYQCVDCMNVKSDRYHKALEEIEHYFEQPCEDCYASSKCQKCIEIEILDIINKAKGSNNEDIRGE